jgi:ABC-2 type transport system permease protein
MTDTQAGEAAAAGWPAPAPGAAPLPKMVGAQASLELRTLLRNGEQLLLILIIPVLLLAAFSHKRLVNFGPGRPIDFLAPGVLALAVMSTAFTSLAIATGFERRYGVLKRLGATPLGRSGLIAAKTLTVLVVELLQAVVIVAVGLALGWRPHAGGGAVGWALLLVLAGTAAFSGLALLMAGTLRAEATLAAANLVYLVMFGLGGVVFPLTKFGAAQSGLKLLPAGALSDGLRSVLQIGGGLPVRDLLVLAAWAAAGVGVTARVFRWE